jgi:hypothetical protein
MADDGSNMKGPEPPGDRPDGIYTRLREMVLHVAPGDIGLMTPIAGDEVWGMLMETGYEGVVATLVALADGTVSLYFSTGGGIIRLGEYEGPRRVAWELLGVAPRFLKYCRAAISFPLPERGRVGFHLFTGHGPASAEAAEEDLAGGRDELSPLYLKAHELMEEIRVVDTELRGPQGGKE